MATRDYYRDLLEEDEDEFDPYADFFEEDDREGGDGGLIEGGDGGPGTVRTDPDTGTPLPEFTGDEQQEITTPDPWEGGSITIPPPPTVPDAPLGAQDYGAIVERDPITGSLPEAGITAAPGEASDFASLIGDSTFDRPDDPAAAQDYLSTIEGMREYEAPGSMGAAPGYDVDLAELTAPDAPGVAPDYEATIERLSEFEQPTDPGAARDFEGIAGGLGAYESAEGAFADPALQGDVTGYARDWMQTPNRYLSELAMATREAGDLRREEQEQDFLRQLDEWTSGRGLVGSSYEGEQLLKNEQQIRLARAEEERALLEMMAGAETADRAAAGAYGISAGEFGRGMAGDIREEGRYSQEDAARRTAMGLEAAGMGEEATMDRAEFGIKVEEIAQKLALQRGAQQVDAQDRANAAEMARAEFGLAAEVAGADVEARRAEIGLEATRLSDMSEQERARFDAEVEKTAQQLAHERGRMEVDAQTRADAAEMARAEFGLEAEITETRAEQVQAGLALDAAEMQERAEQFRSDFDFRVQQEGFDQAFRNVTLEQQDRMQRATLDFQAAMAGDQAAMDRSRLELDQMMAEDSALMDRAQLEQRQTEIDQRAWAIQGEWQMRGQELSQQDAQFMAELEWKKEDLKFRNQQWMQMMQQWEAGG